MKVEDLVLGQEVAVSVKMPRFYKARYLGYGDYGNKGRNLFCCEVFRKDGKSFIDFFTQVYDIEDYNQAEREEQQTEETELNCLRAEVERLTQDSELAQAVRWASEYRVSFVEMGSHYTHLSKTDVKTLLDIYREQKDGESDGR